MKRLLIIVLLLPIMCGRAFGLDIIIAPMKVKQGEIFEIPVVADKVDNLAGIKLVITYDKELLTFKEGNPSKNTRSLMFVINDKNPGRLIVVMAGAKGISGRDLTLLILTFEAKKNLPGAQSTRLEIIENQLMTDQLKEVKAGVNIKPLEILP